ncbi:E3 ubiquitin-protein ligase pub1 [Tieghemiomyces parasiticus]|uniref:E3 ubiquitin-protein ligase pub1 n=1 Tax=Tieghemiomyces parasiticus TaxID=78921 RepID=A0A9W8DTB6_9FUNG|nr:E3 ubiquitin-protein ligase pub1 [Tieghemiomyces parasiticus]
MSSHHPSSPDPAAEKTSPAAAVTPPSPSTDGATSQGCRSLYVGNLDSNITEDELREVFAPLGDVQSVKIITNRAFAHGGLNYGFVEFVDHISAGRALAEIQGKELHDKELKINWAFASSINTREDTSAHFHIFVGDLSPEVNDQILQKAFMEFGNMSDARVMWDAKSGKTRGFGFVAYRDRADAERAIEAMNGQPIGSRSVRVNWANQKGSAPSAHRAKPGNTNYEIILAQTPLYNTTVYLGNLAQTTTTEHIITLLRRFGYIVSTRFQLDRGYAFIKLDTHENATAAIATLNGTLLNDRPLRCSWGKERTAGTSQTASVSGAASATHTPPPAPHLAYYTSPLSGGYPSQPYGYHGGGYAGMPHYNTAAPLAPTTGTTSPLSRPQPQHAHPYPQYPPYPSQQSPQPQVGWNMAYGNAYPPPYPMYYGYDAQPGGSVPAPHYPTSSHDSGNGNARGMAAGSPPLNYAEAPGDHASQPYYSHPDEAVHNMDK